MERYQVSQVPFPIGYSLHFPILPMDIKSLFAAATVAPKCSLCKVADTRLRKDGSGDYTKNCDVCTAGVGQAAQAIYRAKLDIGSSEDDEDPVDTKLPLTLELARNRVFAKKRRIEQLKTQLGNAEESIKKLRTEFLEACERDINQ